MTSFHGSLKWCHRNLLKRKRFGFIALNLRNLGTAKYCALQKSSENPQTDFHHLVYRCLIRAGPYHNNPGDRKCWWLGPFCGVAYCTSSRFSLLFNNSRCFKCNSVCVLVFVPDGGNERSSEEFESEHRGNDWRERHTGWRRCAFYR